jgi:ATP synthase protein I
VSDPDKHRLSDDGRPLEKRVGSSERRKMRAQRHGVSSIWSGMAMFGIIGWSVVIPTLAGVMLGRWLDASYPAPGRSWTLALIIAGLVVGCVTAWRWIAEENRNMHKEE